MKIRIYFSIGIAVLFLTLNVGLTQEVKVLQDQLHYTCGFGYLKGHENEIIQNTRFLNKNLPEQLDQINETQHDIGDILSFYTYNFTSETHELISAVCRAKLAARNRSSSQISGFLYFPKGTLKCPLLLTRYKPL